MEICAKVCRREVFFLRRTREREEKRVLWDEKLCRGLAAGLLINCAADWKGLLKVWRGD